MAITFLSLLFVHNYVHPTDSQDAKENDVQVIRCVQQNSFADYNAPHQLSITYSPQGVALQNQSAKSPFWQVQQTVVGVFKGETAIAATTVNPKIVFGDESLTYAFDKFDIQYQNTDAGMRQNFIVHEQADAPGKLQVQLQFTSEQLQFQCNGNALRGVASNGGQYQYADLNVWDSQHKTLPSTMTFQDGILALVVDDADAVYPITIDPVSTNPDVVLESNQELSRFGYATANAGDVNGDGYDDVMVGAYEYDNGTTNEGGVFIYHGSAAGLSATPAVVLESALASIRYGMTLSGAGDVNNDGYDDVIVGAQNLSNGQSFEGRAYVYHGSASGVNPTPVFTVESNLANTYLGSSVAGAGDINNDGYDDIVIGAKGYTNGQTNEGALYVYRGSATGISAATLVKIESNYTSENLGYSVSTAGDVNNDGYDDIISGSIFYANGQSSEGGAFIYHGSAAGISTTPATTLESNQIGGGMGRSVTSAGDVNGDGYDDVAVGVYTYSNGQSGEGRVYVYHGSASGIPTTPVTTIESNQALANIGVSVCGAGDVNNDGYDDLIAGANLYDNIETDEGRAFIYHGSAAGIGATAVVTSESNQASADYGLSVAGGGDINGDGKSDVIVGSYNFDSDLSNEGAVFVHYGNNCTPSTFYYDGDADGFGLSTNTVESCTVPPFYANNNLDCNDVNALYNPNSIWYADLDDDDYYDESISPIIQCASPGLGYSLNIYLTPGDCDDNYFYANPAQLEVLDNVDNNCDGYVDEDMHFTIDTTISRYILNEYLGYDVTPAGDLNNDGFDDIVVGCYNYTGAYASAGAIMVFHGTATGMNPVPVQIIEGQEASGAFGCSLASDGDMNNDGYNDLIVGAELAEDVGAINNYGQLYLHLGQPDGSFIEGYSFKVELGNIGGANFANKVRYAGDVNGDGYSDLVASIMNFSNGQTGEGAFYIRYGGPTGFGSGFTPESNQISAKLGTCVDGAGDVNNDGYDDVVATAKWYDGGQTDEGAIFVYYGASGGIPLTPDIILESNTINANLSVVSAAGDVNGDGFDDIVAGAPLYDGLISSDEGRVYIYHGSATGFSASPDLIMPGMIGHTKWGENVEGIGDVNGDGYDDIAISSSVATNDHQVMIYVGSSTGINTDVYSIVKGQQNFSFLGSGISAAGDINGDGANDFMIGDPYRLVEEFRDGAVYTYFGLCGNIYYADADLDGYGDPEVSTTGCTPPIGYVTNDLDCNDTNAEIKPGAVELCNGIDDDCNTLTDDGITVSITIAAGGPTVVCQGTPVVLTTTHTGATLQWKRNGTNIAGATSVSYSATTTGIYTCVSSNACASATSSSINVTVNKNPKASITAGGPTTFCAGGSVTLTELPSGGCTYQWYKGASAIAGATTTTYVATTPGNYKCRVTKTATGCFKTSNTIAVTVPCREGEELENEIVVYPNPATTSITISTNNLATKTIFISNALGQIVYQGESDDNAISINIEHLASGMYFVKIEAGNTYFTGDFVKQ